MKTTRILFVLLLAFAASTSSRASENPAAEGFLADQSDSAAIALADQVMDRMGGRTAWDKTRFVSWKFFGRRFHVWDKHTGDIRVEGTDRETEEPYTILMNLHTKEGRAWQSGEEASEEALSGFLDNGEAAWINDSYWMFMPYKLKDTGLAIRDLGSGKLLDGRGASVLELTFRDVGRTPENKYHVYISDESGLVEQWDFYSNADDPDPRFQIPWRNWRRHGSILLSDDRGRGQHSDIAVFDQLPAEVFASPEPVDLSGFERADSENGPKESPIYTVDGDVQKPIRQESVPPAYPAVEEKIEGTVVVRTVIGSDGSIRDAFVTEPLGEGFDAAAVDAIRQWKFSPATLGGEPVNVYYTLTVNFKLSPDGGDPE